MDAQVNGLHAALGAFLLKFEAAFTYVSALQGISLTSTLRRVETLARRISIVAFSIVFLVSLYD